MVLEKHKDFLRDFRGDTIHPSTLEVLHELGILEEFLKRPHQEARTLTAFVGEVEVPFVDFTHLPTHCRFIAFMPQWDFLDFIADHARRYPAFHLRMEAEVNELIEEEGRVVGVRATTPDGTLEVRALLTVGADGRHSTVRARAGFEVEDIGAPIDVLWMRLSRRPTDPDQPLGRVGRGKFFVMIYRGDYWQCGYVIGKGGIEQIKQKGLESFRESIVDVAPFLRDRVAELKDWDDIRLLTVAIDHLKRWSRPGLLCIGDAAHAMSPVGGVGINLAIQDSVATANLLTDGLRKNALSPEDLARVQERRTFPARVTQRLQVFIQDRAIGPVISGGGGPVKVGWPLKLLQWFPRLRRIPARVIGIGIRPEHVRTPEATG
jgi:2-polyprenyl-6-methoxyphenol hydroxylase-like FAD-dependent oxidoreductase